MRLVFAAVLLLSTAPAFAIDAVTYSGTLGDHDIVVELTDPTGSVVAGRYSYLDKGADIPLDAASTEEGVITLAEEAPCTDETCVEDENSEIFKIPVAANWQLKLLEDGSIAGGWNPVADGKALDIKLTEIGRRALPDGTELDVGGLIDSAATIRFESTDNLSADNAPYEFTKLDIPYEQGAEMTLDGSKYRLDIDPRSKFKFPTIVALADGSSPNWPTPRCARAMAASASMRSIACQRSMPEQASAPVSAAASPVLVTTTAKRSIWSICRQPSPAGRKRAAPFVAGLIPTTISTATSWTPKPASLWRWARSSRIGLPSPTTPPMKTPRIRLQHWPIRLTTAGLLANR